MHAGRICEKKVKRMAIFADDFREDRCHMLSLKFARLRNTVFMVHRDCICRLSENVKGKVSEGASDVRL